jgi:hypothetical protein
VPCDRFASPNGSDRRAGTLQHPFRTPERLLLSLKTGQIGCLRKGTYGTAASYHKLLTSGKPTGRKTLTSYPGEVATVAGFVNVLGSYVSLRRLAFDGSNAFLVSPDKCGTQALGITLHGSDIVFEHNDVYQSGMKGSAILQDGDRNIIRYNKLHDFGSCYHYDHGVYLGDGDSVQIYGNWIWNNPHGWGIQVYPGPTNARIHDNVVDANGGGFAISDNGSATSTGNQVYNGTNNSFVSNDAFNNPVGTAPNVTLSGNVTTDPQFLDASRHNYAVSLSSPLASWGLWNGR